MRGASVLLAVSACGGVDAPPEVDIPSLAYPSQLTVTDGESTSFVLSSSDFSHGGAGGMFYSYKNALTTVPQTFDLSPSSPSESVTVTAPIDPTRLCSPCPLILYIPGTLAAESPAMQVSIVDTNAPNVIATSWNVMLSPSSTATFGVQLTQPPSSPVTVTLQSSNTEVASVSPATMDFGAADYNVIQTATLTSAAAGAASISLTSALPAQSVLVSVQ